MILKQASSSFNKASVTDCRPIRHFRKGKRIRSSRHVEDKNEKKDRRNAVAKAYSSTILDRKSPIQSVGSPAPCNLHTPWKNQIKTERGTLSLNPLHRTILEFTT